MKSIIKITSILVFLPIFLFAVALAFLRLLFFVLFQCSWEMSKDIFDYMLLKADNFLKWIKK
jgi:hypothetical protein